MTDHDAYGRCQTCGYPVHQYPFGWQHVGTGMFSCDEMMPLATCCDEHRTCGGCGLPMATLSHGWGDCS